MVPETLLLVLGYSHSDVITMGMLGCSMQLGSDYEVSWSDSAVILDGGRDEVKCFFASRPQPSSVEGHVRIDILTSKVYFDTFPQIVRYLEAYRTRKFRRLGKRAFLSPWELTSRDSFILSMEENEFLTHYVQDPRSRPSASQVLKHEALHPPVLYGREPPDLPDLELRCLDFRPYKQAPLFKTRTLKDFLPSVRLAPQPGFKARTRKGDGKPLPRPILLQNRILELFYKIPESLRSSVKIPRWYSSLVGLPEYYFRGSGKSFSRKQKCLSTLARVYYVYHFLMRKSGNTSTKIRACLADGLIHQLRRSFTERWYAVGSTVYRRLKVLFCPIWTE